MRYSANLNIMVKAAEEASIKTARDFHELEILQSNYQTAQKYANSCYKRVKELIFNDLTKMRPHYNLYASDGSSQINKEDSDYSFLIHPIDGLTNLSRSIPDFTISIALNHQQEGVNNTVACVIYKVIGSELFYSEKGFGSFLNNRKIKTSNRKDGQKTIICNHGNDSNESGTNAIARNFGCKTLEMAYLASGKIDKLVLGSNDSANFEPFYLIAEQSGAQLTKNNDNIIIES